MSDGEQTCRWCGRAITLDRILLVWFDRTQDAGCPLAPRPALKYRRVHLPAD